LKKPSLKRNGDVMGRKKKQEDNKCPISLENCDNPAGKSFKSCYYCGRYDAEENRLLALNEIAAITKATKAPEERNQVIYSEEVRQ